VLADRIIDPHTTDRTAAINPEDRHILEAALAGDVSVSATHSCAER